jgi:hypothetical protein
LLLLLLSSSSCNDEVDDTGTHGCWSQIRSKETCHSGSLLSIITVNFL